MKHILLRLTVTVLGAIAFLLPVRAAAEVRLEEKPAAARVDVISDGAHPWTMTFGIYAWNQGHPTLIPAGADRVFYTSGSTLHLIDTTNGVVLRRWVFSNRIDDVKPDGAHFTVHTSRQDVDKLPETTTIGLDLPSPDYWIDSLLMYRLAAYDGAFLDRQAHFVPEARDGLPPKRYARKPLVREEAERLLVDVKEAVRRNPFLSRLGVDEALLMKDAGHKEADAVFREALMRTDFYGELFWIAEDLDDVGEAEWAGLAFDRAYASFWKHGGDPRLVSTILPKLLMGYLPFDARRDEIPASRRAELSERLYRMAPYVQGSVPAWSALSSYFNERGDAKNATLWRTRASESAAKSGYIGEFDTDANREFVAIAALFVAMLLCQLVLQRRYAPQRRLSQPRGFFAWLRRGDPRSWFAYWDRRDRWMQGFLVLGLWLVIGLCGATVETVNRMNAWPISGSAGSLRAPATREYLKSLSPTPERDFLLALSLQQAGEIKKAESLYRTLPDSASAWNNLGVIQAGRHEAPASAESFRHAVSIEPGMPEGAFNLDQGTDYWAGIHRQYLPGQKMLAMPSHQIVYAAVRGPWLHSLSRIVMGTFSAVPAIVTTFSHHYSDYQIEFPLPFRVFYQFQNVMILGPGFVFAAILLLLLFVPYREATQAPARWHWLLELLVPGTSRSWNVWGALVLGLFIYGILGMFDAALLPLTWPSLGTMASLRAWGLPASMDRTFLAASSMHGSTILASLLFTANAVMVFLRFRRRVQ